MKPGGAVQQIPVYLLNAKQDILWKVLHFQKNKKYPPSAGTTYARLGKYRVWRRILGALHSARRITSPEIPQVTLLTLDQIFISPFHAGNRTSISPSVRPESTLIDCRSFSSMQGSHWNITDFPDFPGTNWNILLTITYKISNKTVLWLRFTFYSFNTL